MDTRPNARRMLIWRPAAARAGGADLAACSALTSKPKVTLKLAKMPGPARRSTSTWRRSRWKKTGYQGRAGETRRRRPVAGAQQRRDLENASLEGLAVGPRHGHLDEYYIDEQKVVENLGPLGDGRQDQLSARAGLRGAGPAPNCSHDRRLQTARRRGAVQDGQFGRQDQFSAGDPSWVQYDEDIIKNVGLDLKVVRAGSEQAVLAALDSAYSRKQPILFYFWTPTPSTPSTT